MQKKNMKLVEFRTRGYLEFIIKRRIIMQVTTTVEETRKLVKNWKKKEKP